MGLSNEERLGKMVWAINALTQLGRDLKRTPPPPPFNDDTLPVVEHIDKLWHAYLGGRANGLYWLVGGDLDGPVTKEGAVWSTAIIYQCESARDKQPDWLADLVDREFNPFHQVLSVEGLLPLEHQQKVYAIYGWTEQLAYALRRYRDSLLAQYEALDKLISDIQGACFQIFQADQAYAKAYVGNQLLEALYSDPKASTVFRELALHNALRKGVHSSSLEDVIAWDRWRLEHRQNLQNCLVLAMRICGPRFDDYHYRKLVPLTRGMSVREPVLQRELEKCKALQAAKKAAEAKRYTAAPGEAAAVGIHGFEVYKLSKKEDSRQED